MIGKFEERGVAWEEDLASNDVDMELDDEVFDGDEPSLKKRRRERGRT